MRPRISRIDAAERFDVRSGPRRSVSAPRVAEHGPHVVVELRQVVREGDLRRVEGRGLARGVRAAPLRERGRERRARRRRAREDAARGGPAAVDVGAPHADGPVTAAFREVGVVAEVGPLDATIETMFDVRGSADDAGLVFSHETPKPFQIPRVDGADAAPGEVSVAPPEPRRQAPGRQVRVAPEHAELYARVRESPERGLGARRRDAPRGGVARALRQGRLAARDAVARRDGAAGLAPERRRRDVRMDGLGPAWKPNLQPDLRV